MATDASSDLVAFQQFLHIKIAEGAAGMSPEESVAAFRAYQHDLERMREAIRKPLEDSLGGENMQVLDMEDMIRAGRARLEAEGITD
jgi:hypothetical protein